jgi:hypothetical protein
LVLGHLLGFRALRGDLVPVCQGQPLVVLLLVVLLLVVLLLVVLLRTTIILATAVVLRTAVIQRTTRPIGNIGVVGAARHSAHITRCNSI